MKQTINLGTAPNGSGGDTPRSAFTKVQANIDEIYAALGAPASGALPAALPIVDGGTAATTAAGARTNLGLKTAALANGVGLVASGDLMEYGSNANGVYFKFLCGLMIQRGTFTGYAASTLKTITMPAFFIDNAVAISVSIVPSTGYDADITCWGGGNQMYFNSPNSRAQNTVFWVAHGKWN